MKHEVVIPGVWEPITRHLEVACCDCGLTHLLVFKVAKGKLWWCVHHRPNVTKGLRRRRDYKCKPKRRCRVGSEKSTRLNSGARSNPAHNGRTRP